MSNQNTYYYILVTVLTILLVASHFTVQNLCF
jgi:hypothetical protein